MQVKRIEPICANKNDIESYLFEILSKGNYILKVENEVVILPRFVLVIEKFLKVISKLLTTLGYSEIECDSVELMLKTIEITDCNKYFSLNKSFGSFSSNSLKVKGVAQLETLYLAKGEILSILDTLDRYAHDNLSLPLIFGKDKDKEVYSWYLLLPNNEFVSVGEVCLIEDNKICFEINFNLLLGLILVHSDEHGVILPNSLINESVVIIPKNKAKIGVLDLCKNIKKSLDNLNSKIDEENINFGYKNAFYDRIGLPIKIIVDKEKDIDKVEIVSRLTHEKKRISIEEVEKETIIILNKTKKELYKKARKKIDEEAIKCGNLQFVSWCGNECLKTDDEHYYCIPFHQILSLKHCDFCDNLGKKYLYILKRNKNF